MEMTKDCLRGAFTTRLLAKALKFETYMKDPKHIMVEYLRVMSALVRDL